MAKEAALRGIAFLWAGLGLAIVMSLCLALAAIAGNRRQGDRPGRTFCLAALVVFAVHAGYAAAPWAVGTPWWRWAFWAMMPPAALACAAASVPILGAIRWTRPDGRSGWTTLAGGWPSALFAGLYIAPPVVLWINTPLDG